MNVKWLNRKENKQLLYLGGVLEAACTKTRNNETKPPKLNETTETSENETTETSQTTETSKIISK